MESFARQFPGYYGDLAVDRIAEVEAEDTAKTEAEAQRKANAEKAEVARKAAAQVEAKRKATADKAEAERRAAAQAEAQKKAVAEKAEAEAKKWRAISQRDEALKSSPPLLICWTAAAFATLPLMNLDSGIWQETTTAFGIFSLISFWGIYAGRVWEFEINIVSFISIFATQTALNLIIGWVNSATLMLFLIIARGAFIWNEDYFVDRMSEAFSPLVARASSAVLTFLKYAYWTALTCIKRVYWTLRALRKQLPRDKKGPTTVAVIGLYIVGVIIASFSISQLEFTSLPSVGSFILSAIYFFLLALTGIFFAAPGHLLISGNKKISDDKNISLVFIIIFGAALVSLSAVALLFGWWSARVIVLCFLVMIIALSIWHSFEFEEIINAIYGWPSDKKMAAKLVIFISQHVMSIVIATAPMKNFDAELGELTFIWLLIFLFIGFLISLAAELVFIVDWKQNPIRFLFAFLMQFALVLGLGWDRASVAILCLLIFLIIFALLLPKVINRIFRVEDLLR